MRLCSFTYPEVTGARDEVAKVKEPLALDDARQTAAAPDIVWRNSITPGKLIV